MRSHLVYRLCLVAFGCAVAVSAQTTAAPSKPAPVVSGPLKLRVAHVYDVTHPWHKSFERFRDVLVAKSNGTLDAQIFPKASLGNEKECVSYLRQGVLDVTTVTANGLEAVTPEVTFLDLLYLWKDRDHWQRALDGDVGQRITELIRSSTSKGGAAGFEVLGYWGGSQVNMISRKRGYETLEDLAKAKIRVQDSPLQMELWKALGAAPISLPQDRVRGALQDGTIESVPLTNSTNLTAKFHEVAPHLSAMSLAIVARPMLISGHTWAKLTAEQRTAVREAGKEATQVNRALEAELSDGAVAQLERDHGVKVYAFKDAHRVRERIRGVQERYAAKLGLLDLLRTIDQEWDQGNGKVKK
jgi:TRAP-type transport system periplasmic protein